MPHELNDDQRSELTAAIARALVERYRFAIQASIHEPQTADGLNYHAHLLATTRRIGGEGLADKTRELDGGPSGRGEVEWIREMVAETINAHLDAAGIASRVDHRSLKDQAQTAVEDRAYDTALALSREPTQHMGKNATKDAPECRGISLAAVPPVAPRRLVKRRPPGGSCRSLRATLGDQLIQRDLFALDDLLTGLDRRMRPKRVFTGRRTSLFTPPHQFGCEFQASGRYPRCDLQDCGCCSG